jgi:hypothetical protein
MSKMNSLTRRMVLGLFPRRAGDNLATRIGLRSTEDMNLRQSNQRLWYKTPATDLKQAYPSAMGGSARWDLGARRTKSCN